MDANNPIFNEFRAYWRLSEDLIADATKEDLGETARILAMQTAHYARKYGELPIPDMAHLMSPSSQDDESLSLLRDGTAALVGILGMVAGTGGVDIDATIQ